MRISHFPIFTIEMALGTELLSEMDERAMKACVTRNLPDVRLDLVHIVESRAWPYQTEASAQHPPHRYPVLKR
jgi:hypothetical protein